MRTRLRAGGQSISFFAFQDIITSVIGILLFISLLLALFIGVESQKNLPSIERTAADPADLARLDELLNEISKLQALVTASVTAPTEEDARRKHTALQQEWADLENLIAKTLQQNASVDVQKSEEVRKEVAVLGAMNNEIKKRLEQLKEEARRSSDSVNALTLEVEQKESALLAEQQHKNDVWLIPEMKNTTKKPLIIIANTNNFVVKALDAEGHQIADRTGDQLSILLKGYDPVDYFVVMYYRPSTFHTFKEIADSIRKMKFDLGYDAIGEDQNISFREKKTP